MHRGFFRYIGVLDLLLLLASTTLEHVSLLMHDFIQYFVIVVIYLLFLFFLIYNAKIYWYRNLVIYQRNFNLSFGFLPWLYWMCCFWHYLVIIAVQERLHIIFWLGLWGWLSTLTFVIKTVLWVIWWNRKFLTNVTYQVLPWSRLEHFLTN